MMMKCVILQPGYLPWIGFFDQMIWADLFVIYDDVQYTSRDWRSRNRIKTKQGPKWLTVPVKNKGLRYQLINEVEIDYGQGWIHKHLESIRHAYAHAPYYNSYYDGLAAVYQTRHKRLINLDVALIRYFLKVLNIKTQILFSSDMDVEGRSSIRLLNICKKCNVDDYLTGDAAADYLNMNIFESSGIQVRFHNYEHPIYKQLYGAFVPYLSIIDLLFNCGHDSLGILHQTEVL